MMEKVGQPKGLVRFASETNIAEHKPFSFTLKTKAYAAVLSVLFCVFVGLLFSRSDIDATILRTPGMLYQVAEDGRISNLFNYKLINKTEKESALTFEIEGGNGEVQFVGKAPEIKAGGIVEGTFFILFDTEYLEGRKTKFKINVKSKDQTIETVSSSFVGPNSY